MSRNKLHVKKGDTVKVITGDDKGKTGVITSVITDKQKVVVEGLNLVSKHQKPTAKNPNGGIVKQEAPIHASNVMLVEPSTNAPTRTGKKLNNDGKLQRYSKKSGNLI
ncbi:50S ribosomal protein L24 [Rufibacter immobilis]|uniref:Large ribosomal subunit protein uL24 n=1 Tax=Rufibacter immobilis TaxID=1348778 RepID=A0A3M9N6Z7_9BACT|nr:50S ribosomal protein L24 [Rufibacter immobilis]RNI33077.1 50S ribosomal protein L24 [Rufibacter immobilis]